MENKRIWPKSIKNNISMFLKLYIHDMKEKILLIFATTVLCLCSASFLIEKDWFSNMAGHRIGGEINEDLLGIYVSSVLIFMIGLLEIKTLSDIKKRREGDNEYIKIIILRITTVITAIAFMVVTGSLIVRIINHAKIEPIIEGLNNNLIKPVASLDLGMTYVFIVASILSFTSMKDLDYLHDKRKSDLYESMPISKRVLLLEKIMVAYSKSIIPYILATIAPIIICVSNGVDPTAVWNDISFTCICILLNIVFCSLICVCCGKKTESVITYIIMNVFLIGLVLMISKVRQIIPGEVLVFRPETAMQYVAPLMAIFNKVLGNRLDNMFDYYLADSKFSGNIMLTVVGVLLVIQLFIIKYRKTESAEDKYGFNQMYAFIKYFAAVVTGMFAGLYLASANEDLDLLIQIAMFMIAAVSSVLLVYIILHVVYHREIKNITKEIKGITVSLITIAVIMITFMAGLPGGEKYQPKLEDIEYVEINVNKSIGLADSHDVISRRLYSEESIRTVLNIHKDIIKDYSNEKEYGLNKIRFEESNDYHECLLSYKLKNGQIINRAYYGYVLSEEAIEQIKKISPTEEFLGLDLNDKSIIEIGYVGYDQNGYTLLKVSDECLNDIEAFRDVYLKEADAKKENYEEMTDSKKKKIDIMFKFINVGSDDYDEQGIDITVTEDMKESYRMIKEIYGKHRIKNN